MAAPTGTGARSPAPRQPPWRPETRGPAPWQPPWGQGTQSPAPWQPLWGQGRRGRCAGRGPCPMAASIGLGLWASSLPSCALPHGSACGAAPIAAPVLGACPAPRQTPQGCSLGSSFLPYGGTVGAASAGSCLWGVPPPVATGAGSVATLTLLHPTAAPQGFFSPGCDLPYGRVWGDPRLILRRGSCAVPILGAPLAQGPATPQSPSGTCHPRAPRDLPPSRLSPFPEGSTQPYGSFEQLPHAGTLRRTVYGAAAPSPR